jgi:hypothetical protein
MREIEDGIAIYCLRRNAKDKDKNTNTNQIKMQNAKIKDVGRSECDCHTLLA